MNTQQHGGKRLYNTLAVLAYLMDIICPGHHWQKRLITLIEKHNLDTHPMGFPSDWKDKPVWKQGAVSRY